MAGGQPLLGIGTEMYWPKARRHGASGYFVTLDTPLHDDVAGDSAYVVVPATMSFTVDGNKVTQFGAVFTVALRQRPDGSR